jgi:hypothetical protein
MLAAHGGINNKRQGERDDESEDTPLLVDGNGNSNDDTRQRKSLPYGPWDEFAHLPWWKKPSVGSYNPKIDCHPETNSCRHTGF